MVWICVCLWAFCLSWSSYLTVDPTELLGFNFSVYMCLLVKQKQKQNRNMQVFILHVSVVYNSLIVYV